MFIIEMGCLWCRTSDSNGKFILISYSTELEYRAREINLCIYSITQSVAAIKEPNVDL